MKIKYLFFQALLAIVILLAVNAWFDALLFATNSYLPLVFWGIFLITLFVAPRIRTFLLLPPTFLFEVLVQTVLVGLVLWFSVTFVGGVRVQPFSYETFDIVGVILRGTTLSIFGTIAVVSVLFSFVLPDINLVRKWKMSQQLVSILQIVVGIIGILVILAQNRSEQGSSFFGGGDDVFKLRKGVDRIMFYATFVVIIVLAVLIYVDIKLVN